MIGNLLAGLAGSMSWLIAFRVIQGIGAGAIQPISITMIADLYEPSERPRIQGYAGTVWACAAVVGPLAGGLIVDHLSWGWIFWINVPIGMLTIAGFVMFLNEDVAAKSAKVDYIGTVLFAVAIVCLLVLLTATGLPTSSLVALALGCLLSATLFILQERRAAEPVVPIMLWGRRLLASSNSASFLAGMALIGVTTVLPLYVQGVMNRIPLAAGFTLTALIIGWTLALGFASRFFKTLGIEKTLRVSSPTFPIGAACLLLLTPESNLALATIGTFCMGMGMGLISATSIVLVQGGVEKSVRGRAPPHRSYLPAVSATP